MIKLAARYRKALSSDIVRLSRLDKLANQTWWNEAQYHDSLANHHHYLYVAEYMGDIIGCIVFAAMVDEIEILQLWVVEKFRGNQIASNLLTRTIAQGRQEFGVSKFFLEVVQSNQAAINCYKKAGFVSIAVRKNYYQIDGNFYNAVVMGIV